MGQAGMKTDSQHIRRLHCPTGAELAAVYAEMPAQGQLEVTCALADLPLVLPALEQSGFFGMVVSANQRLRAGVTIHGHKGKYGPCYDTGKSATYTGSALAAVDDDHHLFSGPTRVCEKTARLLGLPAYREVVRLTPGDAGLAARLRHDPEPFDCDTFAEDCARLAQTVVAPKRESSRSLTLLYPGPFRMLILEDGKLLRRGAAVRLPAGQAQRLIAAGECLPVPEDLGIAAEMPPNFATLCREHGARVLLDLSPGQTQSEASPPPYFDSLDQAPAALRQRLLKVIDSQAEYFIMTGSDARDVQGCCPSDSVTAANRLVEAGVLQVARTGDAQAGCPANIYAFRGELCAQPTGPAFTIDPELREKVKQRLQRPARSPYATALRWLLLLFVVASFGAMVANMAREREMVSSAASAEQLISEFDLPFRSGIAVLLFHRTPRCAFCNALEANARATIDHSDFVAQQRPGVALRLADMASPQAQAFMRQYGVMTVSLVIVTMRDDRIEQVQTFVDGWHLADDRETFVARLREVIDAAGDE